MINAFIVAAAAVLVAAPSVAGRVQRNEGWAGAYLGFGEVLFAVFVTGMTINGATALQQTSGFVLAAVFFVGSFIWYLSATKATAALSIVYTTAAQMLPGIEAYDLQWLIAQGHLTRFYKDAQYDFETRKEMADTAIIAAVSKEKGYSVPKEAAETTDIARNIRKVLEVT